MRAMPAEKERLDGFMKVTGWDGYEDLIAHRKAMDVLASSWLAHHNRSLHEPADC
jgi:hypothetical protein